METEGTENNIDKCVDPCRIVIIGLPYSGKKEVAKILHTKYNCKLLDIND
jgi:dephospho-CoA kinase